MKQIGWFIIIALFILIGFALFGRESKIKETPRLVDESKGSIRSLNMERIEVITSDKTKIIGDYYPRDSAKGILLLHMMPADRTSWRTLAPKLQEQGYQVLAIDLRGHGESAMGPSGYKGFTDQEHQKSLLDVEAGVEFLGEKGAEDISIIGASIGANLALWYATEHSGISQIVLLSPGLDYRGIKTEPLIQKLNSTSRIFLATSEDDYNNADMTKRLYSLIPEGVEKKMIVYKNAGHGTNMFGKELPDLEEEILDWIK